MYWRRQGTLFVDVIGLVWSFLYFLDCYFYIDVFYTVYPCRIIPFAVVVSASSGLKDNLFGIFRHFHTFKSISPIQTQQTKRKKPK